MVRYTISLTRVDEESLRGVVAVPTSGQATLRQESQVQFGNMRSGRVTTGQAT